MGEQLEPRGRHRGLGGAAQRDCRPAAAGSGAGHVRAHRLRSAHLRGQPGNHRCASGYGQPDGRGGVPDTPPQNAEPGKNICPDDICMP